jgi:sugar lactone lactonase YvrE
VFADLSGDEPGVPDGMKVDVEGNVYCGGSGGIWIMEPSGKKLGRIVHGQPATTNIAFGGDDWKGQTDGRKHPAMAPNSYGGVSYWAQQYRYC